VRALVQRVKKCAVSIDGQRQSAIGPGMLILLGVKKTDTAAHAGYLADRCAALRIFDDSDGKMNISVRESNGEVMVVSQFTLYGDTRKGNRPSYSEAAGPEHAETLYNDFVRKLRSILGEARVRTGTFRAMMDVELINDGPVTVMIESKNEVPS